MDRGYVRTGVRNVLARLVSYVFFEGRPLTTRGRYANPAIRVALNAAARGCQGDSPERPPAFIVGLGRSGTTLLGKLLSVHPDIAWLNEPKLLWHVAYPFEDVIGSYSDKSDGRLKLTATDVTVGTRRKINAMFAGYVRTVRRSQIVDKYPELIYRVDFVKELFPGAKFVVLQRNAASAASSITAWNLQNARAGADWWGRDGQKWKTLYDEIFSRDEELAGELKRSPKDNAPEAMALAEWLASVEAAMSAQWNGCAHFIKYEDLVTDPVSTLRDIASFLSLAHSAEFEQYGRASCRPSREEILEGQSLPPRLMARVKAAERRLGYSSVT